MSGLAVFAVEIGPVAVLVPPGSFVRQGTVSDGNVVVSVFCGEGSALVVAQRITCDQRKGKGSALNISTSICGIAAERRWRCIRGGESNKILLHTLRFGEEV